MRVPLDTDTEWLEADGLGGFASGTTLGLRTRRYHALLLCAARPPAERFALVAGLEVRLRASGREVPLGAQRYVDVVHPDGHRRLVDVRLDPWPAFRYALDDGRRLVEERIVPRGLPLTIVRWRLEGAPVGDERLLVRPLLACRDLHGLLREHAHLDPRPSFHGHVVRYQPHAGAPAVLCASEGWVRHDPIWYRGFLYDEERRRGFDCVEDLWSPAEIAFDLSGGSAEAIFAMDAPDVWRVLEPPSRPSIVGSRLLEAERRRREAFPTRLHRAADAYVVRGERGTEIVAGYPWFGSWGRDTFVALRGLLLATGRFDEAFDVLARWADTIDGGMIPNFLGERGEPTAFNAADASLWYVVAAGELFERWPPPAGPRTRRIREAMLCIVETYRRGARFGIRVDADGLLAAGAPGMQLTWMDARVGSRPVTPRVGKPVELQALWVAACEAAARIDARWESAARRARAAFEPRFWNEALGWLHDVVDVDHEPGRVDPSLRPNQIFAVGGLPRPLLDPRAERARRIVEAVERHLWTPLGLRSLASFEPGYRGRYEGGAAERDGAYHQGTVWPWLTGPFVEAWLRVRGDDEASREEARRRFVAPLHSRLDAGGWGHVAEIADGDPPHTPRGAPFQAWSVGELLRLEFECCAPRAVFRASSPATPDADPSPQGATAPQSPSA
ncbi:MAG: amylo-alpha-1,6-glucosidase [Myxococcales bacterium]|nr:amylo-alpha-1,6-glucosidase [Myxococcales bacterium]